jgi:hypothetical protein
MRPSFCETGTQPNPGRSRAHSLPWMPSSHQAECQCAGAAPQQAGWWRWGPSSHTDAPRPIKLQREHHWRSTPFCRVLDPPEPGGWEGPLAACATSPAPTVSSRGATAALATPRRHDAELHVPRQQLETWNLSMSLSLSYSCLGRASTCYEAACN